MVMLITSNALRSEKPACGNYSLVHFCMCGRIMPAMYDVGMCAVL